MKTKMIPVLALSMMGIFATATFAQEEAVPASDDVVAQETVAPEKVDPRADRAKERFERKDAKKAEIAEHKAEMKALKEERAAARAERKEAKKAEIAEHKAEMKALKDERAAARAERKEVKKAEKEARKANRVKGHS